MALKREDWHRIIDQIPEEKLKKIDGFLKELIEEDDEEIDEETLREIKEAEEQIKNGEYITLDELLKKIKDDL